MLAKSILILTVLTTLTFANSLSNGFVGDDEFLIVNNSFYQSWQNLPKIFSKEYLTDSNRTLASPEHQSHSGSVAYRPVLSLTYFIDYSFWQVKPFGYHLTNLLIHLGNTALVFMLIFFLLKNQQAAFLSTLIFSVHPLKSEAVCSIGYRADSLACLWLLLSFLCYVRLSEANVLKCRLLLFLSAAFYFLGVFTKESVIIYPLLLFFYDWFIRRPKITFSALFPYCIFIFITAFYLFVYTRVFPNQTLSYVQWMGGTLVTHVGAMIHIFTLYLGSFFVPVLVKTLPPQYVPPLEDGWGYQTWISFLVLSGFLFILIRSIRIKKETAFWSLWFLVSFIPVSNLIPLPNPMAYRFMYLPSVGLSVLAALGLETLIKIVSNIRMARFIQGGIIVFCMIWTMALNMMWKNGRVMAFKMMEDFPKSPIGYLFSGIEFCRLGMMKEATAALTQGLHLGLKDPRAYYFLGMCSPHDLKQSKIYFQKGIQEFPFYPQSFRGLGRVYLLQGEYDQAIFYLKKSIQLAPMYSAYGYLIQAYLMKGDAKKAQAVLHEAESFITNSDDLSSLRRFFNPGEKEKFPIDIGI